MNGIPIYRTDEQPAFKKSNFGSSHTTLWYANVLGCKALNFVGGWSEKAAAAADTEGSAVVNVTVIWEYGSKSKYGLFHTHLSEQSWNGLP